MIGEMSHLIIPHLVQLRETVGKNIYTVPLIMLILPIFLGISTCFANTALYLEVVNYFAY